MTDDTVLDCVIIGYNEPPFARYEALVRAYGDDSEAYRDLKFSFVGVEGQKLDYIGLMNHVRDRAVPRADVSTPNFTSGEIPNLAAVYLTNYLRQRRFAAEYVNLFQHERDRLAALLARNPVCVAITTTFYILAFPVTEMVEWIRRHNTRTRIVVGGPLIANYARRYRDGDAEDADERAAAFEAALRELGADVYVIESQGEHTLSRLITCFKSGSDLAEVSNVAYFERDALRVTGVQPENNPLDEVAIDWLRFANEPLGPTIQTRTARSCAFSCAFCNYPTRAGQLTLASLETIERELDAMRTLGTVRHVVFIDDTFNVPLERFKDICRLMIRKQYGFKWFSYYRCSNSDEEAMDLMARAGCTGVFLGIESGSGAMLKHMHKAATLEKYERGLRWLHERQILSFASFIIGFPGETDATVEETRAFIRDTRPDYYRAQLWYCEPGTPIDRQRAQYGTRGSGFVWSHATMDSRTAMNHIERLFLAIRESTWLPQWSFDFWIIPYLLGKGLSAPQFASYTRVAQKILALDIAAVSPATKARLKRVCLEDLVAQAREWELRNDCRTNHGHALAAH